MDGITPISPNFITPLTFEAPAASIPKPLDSSFNDVLTGVVNNTDGRLAKADAAVKDLMDGRLNNPHEVMIRLEEANLNLQLTLQMRNKVLDAYNDIMRMQL